MQDQDIFSKIEKYQSFAAGQIIFNQGDAGQHLYIVAEGQVEVRIGDRVLETVGPGGILGEMAMIDDKPRSATAIAYTDCVLAPVSREHFLALVQRTPRFVLQVMRVIAERLRRTTSKLCD